MSQSSFSCSSVAVTGWFGLSLLRTPWRLHFCSESHPTILSAFDDFFAVVILMKNENDLNPSKIHVWYMVCEGHRFWAYCWVE